MKIQPQWKGFVPAQHSHPLKLCAVYHCPKERCDGRRWCKSHAEEYDKQASEGQCKVLTF